MTVGVDRAEQLTQQHRTAQVAIAALALKRLTQLWPLLDPLRLDRTGPAWVDAMSDTVAAAFAGSVSLARQYLQAVRTLDLGVGITSAPTVAVSPNLAAIRTSLLVTGPIGVKQRTAALARPPADAPQRPLLDGIDEAMKAAFVDVSGATMRHVLAGGRGLVTEQVQADPKALGWARRSDGTPCAFCAMLISRGPVYKAASFAESDPRFVGEGQFKVHDHDGCTVRPMYRDDVRLPDVDRYADLWRTSGAVNLSGLDAVNAFRRAYSKGPA